MGYIVTKKVWDLQITNLNVVSENDSDIEYVSISGLPLILINCDSF